MSCLQVWLINQTPAPNVSPLRNKGLIWPYAGKPLLNKPVTRPYFSGGDRLTSRDWLVNQSRSVHGDPDFMAYEIIPG